MQASSEEKARISERNAREQRGVEEGERARIRMHPEGANEQREEGAHQRAECTRAAMSGGEERGEERAEGINEASQVSSIGLGGGKGKGRGRERNEGEEKDLLGRGKRPRCEPPRREGSVTPVAAAAARLPRTPRLVRRGGSGAAGDKVAISADVGTAGP